MPKLKPMRKVTPVLAANLMEELVNGKHDAFSLARVHKLRADALIEWIANPDTQRRLRAYCLLADTQAQVMISRHRPHAANRLVRLATSDEKTPEGQPAIDPDLARRACVDLLKVDISSPSAPSASSLEAGAPDTTTARGFREALFGESKKVDG